MAGRLSNPNQQFFDENGDPLAGGKLDFFETGTSTRQDTYSDDALTVLNTNPVILDDAGRAGDIFLLDSDYKVVLSKSDDTVVWTADPVRSPSQKSSEVRKISTTTELDISDDGKWIAADATSGGFVITLPATATVGNGYGVTIQKTDTSTNVVTVDGNGSETINGAPTFNLTAAFSGAEFRCDGTTWYVLIPENTPLPRGYIDGFQIRVAADVDNDRIMETGKLRNSADTQNVSLSQELTKKIDEPWAQGNNQGGLFTGSLAADTSYHYIVIVNNTSFDVDWGWDIDPGGANAPSGWTAQRRVGSVKSFDDAGTPKLPQTTQKDGFFSRQSHNQEAISGVNTGATPSAHALADVPTGVELQIRGVISSIRVASAAYGGVFDHWVTSVQNPQSFQAGTQATGATNTQAYGYFEAWCDETAQVKLARFAADDSITVVVHGWYDPRGSE